MIPSPSDGDIISGSSPCSHFSRHRPKNTQARRIPFSRASPKSKTSETATKVTQHSDAEEQLADCGEDSQIETLLRLLLGPRISTPHLKDDRLHSPASSAAETQCSLAQHFFWTDGQRTRSFGGKCNSIATERGSPLGAISS